MNVQVLVNKNVKLVMVLEKMEKIIVVIVMVLVTQPVILVMVMEQMNVVHAMVMVE
jgi:hypothetical protein